MFTKRVRRLVGIGIVFALMACTGWAQEVLYVDGDAPPGGDGSSWNTAYNYVQDALGAAQAESEEAKLTASDTALLVLRTAEAPADILMFTHEGSGSGTLDGEPFPLSDFVITAFADTDDRQIYQAGWFIDHLSASIRIDGLGDFDFLSPTRHFVNNIFSVVGFSRAGIGGHDLFNGPTDPEFGTWDMLGPIGPISGEGRLFQWGFDPLINTTGGILFFNDGISDATFTAVPEPATLAILVLGGVALMVRRRAGAPSLASRLGVESRGVVIRRRRVCCRRCGPCGPGR